MGAPRVPSEQIPEVKEFEWAERELEDFKGRHADVFNQYLELAERRNTALEQAEKAVRAKGVSCGPFDGYQTNDRIDAEKLAEIVPEKEFLKYGGQETTKVVHTVDRKKFIALAQSGQIPKQILDQVFEPGWKYKKPHPITP